MRLFWDLDMDDAAGSKGCFTNTEADGGDDSGEDEFVSTLAPCP